MNSDTAENPVKIVLDTNVLISAILYGGKPEQIFMYVLKKRLIAITSRVLISELQEALIKKFDLASEKIKRIEKKMSRTFTIVYPRKQILILRDDDDNRVLEAAVEGKCDYIVTGDQDLLDLKQYKKIKIVKPSEFLKLIETNGE